MNVKMLVTNEVALIYVSKLKLFFRRESILYGKLSYLTVQSKYSLHFSFKKDKSWALFS